MIQVTVLVKFFKPSTGKFTHEENLSLRMIDFDETSISEGLREHYSATQHLDYVYEAWDTNKRLFASRLVKAVN